MRRSLVLAVAALAWALAWVLAPTAASAQQAGNAVADLRENNVTFEPDALSESQLRDLDRVTDGLQSDGYFKVVVLAQNVDAFPSTEAFANEVRAGLGGQGRVLVISPSQLALSSNADASADINRAEQAAASRLNAGGSLASAVSDSADALGVQAPTGAPEGSTWLLLLLVVVVPLFVAYVMWKASRKQREQVQKLSAEEVGAAEAKVREAVDTVANDLLELSDKVDQPDTPAEARTAFGEGAEMFTASQKALDEANARPDLEAAYDQVVRAGWKLDVAKAHIAGESPPAEPQPEKLFPEPVVPKPDARIPERATHDGRASSQPQYRQLDTSPWITAAATAALAMLAGRGVSVPQTRPAMDDGIFGSWIGNLPSRSAGSRSSRGGFGRGAGSIGIPSGGGMAGRGMGGRGMGRR